MSKKLSPEEMNDLCTTALQIMCDHRAQPGATREQKLELAADVRKYILDRIEVYLSTAPETHANRDFDVVFDFGFARKELTSEHLQKMN